MTVDSTARYADDAGRWEAVLRRDQQADGVFFYAVRTTGVYCRPSCPARRPRRENVVLFDTAESAQHAGFRPCQRCRPDMVSTQQRAVAQVRQLLETAEPAPSLAELGRAVGLSPFYLQRLFKRATGMSPRDYAMARRAERLKARLREGATVTDALYDAGYGSARALYETAHGQLGMSPRTYRSGGPGVTIAHWATDSPLGRILLAATPLGLCALKIGDDEGALLAELRAEFSRAELVADAAAVAPYVQAVLAFLDGRDRHLDLPLDVAATDFQRRVWAALQTIQYGETRSYGELADMVGAPRAVRAAARACATNPVALVVPCHRIVGADGSLRGYRWGMDRKRDLLERERAAAGARAGRD